jgi:hypothetical protein
MAIGSDASSSVAFPQNPDDLIQPEEPVFLYEFQALPDPPDDYEFLKVRYGTVADGSQRTLRMAQMIVLMKHFFWGIRWGEPQQTAKTTRRAHSLKTLIKALWKLFYYMQDIHRPKSWDEVLNVHRDSGPRLLRYDLSPRPSPISRWFGIVPHNQTVILPAYSRPDGAPLDLPDILLQQYLYSADSFNDPSIFQPPLPPQLPFQQPPTHQQMHANFHFEPAPLPLPPPPTEEEQDMYTQDSLLAYIRGDQPIAYGQKRDAQGLETSPNKRRRDVSPGAPPAPHLSEPVFATRNILEWNWMPGLNPENVAPPFGEPEIGPIIPSTEPVYEKRAVSEAVEKAVMRLVYTDLERDPSVPSRQEPIRYLTAHTFADMLDLKIGSFSTIAKVKLSPLSFYWDPNGSMFPLRGRGPVWSANSCATDCVIVAGMLMDVGCTRIDRANNRASEFTDYEKAYIEITNAAWETFDEPMSIRVRDEFLQGFMNGQQHMKMGEPIPPWALWSQVTKGFAQFRYHHIERVTPCKCQAAQPFVNSHQGSCILPGYRSGDDKGVSAGTLIERCFYAKKLFACSNCGDPSGVTGERKIGQLPLRLVMTFDTKTRLRNHTQNTKFRYIDYENNKQVAHYRWIGGIYNNELHARVYWTDSKRGGENGTNLMMYDSELNKGVMAGGIPAFRPDDRVPTEWVDQKSIPLLFYERVMDPSRKLLATAHDAVYDMGNIIGRNKSILEAHVPWTSSNSEPEPEPWGRILSHAGERFNDFNPTWALNTQNTPTRQTGTVGNPSVDPNLVDPSVVDQSLLDPALYSTTVAPTFDISSLLDPTAFGEEEYMEDEAQGKAEDRFKNHMFSSMLETPDFLSGNIALWPSGAPREEGALEFPDLPTWPSPKGRKHRSRTSRSDTSMPDAEDYAAGTHKSSYTHGLKTAVMLNQNVDPKMKAIQKAREQQREFQEYMKQRADDYYTEKEEREKDGKREKGKGRADENAEQREYRKSQARRYMEWRAKEEETPEERQLRKNRERRTREEQKEAGKEEAEASKKRAYGQTRSDATGMPPSPGPSSHAPWSLPQTPGPLSQSSGPPLLRGPSSLHLTRPEKEEPKPSEKKPDTQMHTAGNSAFIDKAEERRRALIVKREASKKAPVSNAAQMRKQHAEDKMEERGRRPRKKDDDPTWTPDGDDYDSDPDC